MYKKSISAKKINLISCCDSISDLFLHHQIPNLIQNIL